MTVTTSNRLCTYEDYRELPEDMAQRYELLHGELIMVPSPTTRHQRISRKLERALDQHVTDHELGEVFDAPIDVILGEGDAREVVQPDLVFIAKAQRDIVELHGIEGAPDLVVEIVSPATEERDRGYKKTLYARYRVKEYWIVDPDARTVERYRLGDQGFNAPESFDADATLTSELLPGLVISLAEVFAEPSD